MGIGWIPIPIGNSTGMGIDDTIGNGNVNKFPPADAVFSLCNSNVKFII